VRKLEERVWKEENQRGKHIPGYGGFLPLEENSPANDVRLPRYHAPDMEEWGGKTPKYCGHKPEVKDHYRFCCSAYESLKNLLMS